MANTIIAGFKSFFDTLSPSRDEDRVTKFVTKSFVAIFIIFTLGASVDKIFGDRIDCYDNTDTITNLAQFNKFADAYCWSHHRQDSNGTTHLSHYQWAPIVFPAQAILFLIPGMLWGWCSSFKGCNINEMVKTYQIKSGDRKAAIKYLANMLKRTVIGYDKFDKPHDDGSYAETSSIITGEHLAKIWSFYVEHKDKKVKDWKEEAMRNFAATVKDTAEQAVRATEDTERRAIADTADIATKVTALKDELGRIAIAATEAKEPKAAIGTAAAKEAMKEAMDDAKALKKQAQQVAEAAKSASKTAAETAETAETAAKTAAEAKTKSEKEQQQKQAQQVAEAAESASKTAAETAETAAKAAKEAKEHEIVAMKAVNLANKTALAVLASNQLELTDKDGAIFTEDTNMSSVFEKEGDVRVVTGDQFVTVIRVWGKDTQHVIEKHSDETSSIIAGERLVKIWSFYVEHKDKKVKDWKEEAMRNFAATAKDTAKRAAIEAEIETADIAKKVRELKDKVEKTYKAAKVAEEAKAAIGTAAAAAKKAIEDSMVHANPLKESAQQVADAAAETAAAAAAAEAKAKKQSHEEQTKKAEAAKTAKEHEILAMKAVYLANKTALAVLASNQLELTDKDDAIFAEDTNMSSVFEKEGDLRVVTGDQVVAVIRVWGKDGKPPHVIIDVESDSATCGGKCCATTYLSWAYIGIMALRIVLVIIQMLINGAVIAGDLTPCNSFSAFARSIMFNETEFATVIHCKLPAGIHGNETTIMCSLPQNIFYGKLYAILEWLLSIGGGLYLVTIIGIIVIIVRYPGFWKKTLQESRLATNKDAWTQFEKSYLHKNSTFVLRILASQLDVTVPADVVRYLWEGENGQGGYKAAYEQAQKQGQH